MSRKLAGSVVMSKASGHAGNFMHISVDDKISGCRVIEIEMSLEEFAKSLTASYGEAVIEHFNAPVGMKAEHKTEKIKLAAYTRDKDKLAAALAPYEVDGWKGDASDLTNHHRGTKDGQLVSFFRHVDPETGKSV